MHVCVGKFLRSAGKWLTWPWSKEEEHVRCQPTLPREQEEDEGNLPHRN